MKYASIDIETGGLNPLVHSVLEIGVVIEDMEKLVPLDQLPKCRLLVHPLEDLGYYRLEPYAAGLNADLLRIIKDFPVSVKDATLIKPQFVGKFLEGFFSEHDLGRHNEKGPRSVVAGGKNFASFDSRFLNVLPDFDKMIRFKHRTLDPMMFYLRPDDERPPDLRECCKRAEIDLSSFKLHTAVDDAKLVVELIRRGMRLNVGDRQEVGPKAEGRRAWGLGKVVDDNPYVIGTMDGDAWLRGFLEAKDQG